MNRPRSTGAGGPNHPNNRQTRATIIAEINRHLQKLRKNDLLRILLALERRDMPDEMP